MIKKFLDFMETLFNEHKLVRRLLVLWVMLLLTFIAWRLYSPAVIATIPHAIGQITVAFVGLLTVVVALYKWSRDRDDRG